MGWKHGDVVIYTVDDEARSRVNTVEAIIVSWPSIEEYPMLLAAHITTDPTDKWTYYGVKGAQMNPDVVHSIRRHPDPDAAWASFSAAQLIGDLDDPS